MAGKAAEINQICDDFKGAGCVLVPSGCPGPPGAQGFTCENNLCVWHGP